jgi:hypothetical protein
VQLLQYNIHLTLLDTFLQGGDEMENAKQKIKGKLNAAIGKQ